MWRAIYLLMLLLSLGFAGISLANKAAWQTDFAALLPEALRPDELWLAADKANEAQINQEVVLLAGHADAEQAFGHAQEIADLWRKSGVFVRVDDAIAPDLTKLGRQAKALGIATLPEQTRALLFHAPQDYFQQRARAALNPFAPALIALDEDWTGFAGETLAHTAPNGRLQWHSDNGMLYSEADGQTWVWLRGVLPEQGVTASRHLPEIIAQSRVLAQRNGGSVLTTGGALFAAAAKADAEREMQWMSGAGLLFTFGLLFAVFRSARVLALLLSIGAGLAFGLAASLLVFGKIHVLTLVIGTSLVGMLVDFPLHWLAPALFFRQPEKHLNALWQPERSMRELLPAFGTSLAITVSGYVLLWFTPLPVLRQTAVFSAAALLGALGATVWLLPPLFRGYQPQTQWLPCWAERAWRLSWGRWGKVAAGLLLLWVIMGISRSQWRDDMRQWVAMQPEMLHEAQQIGVLSGSSFGTQLVLVEGRNEEELLQRSAEAAARLRRLVAEKKLDGVQALSDWLLPSSEQKKLKQQLLVIAKQPENWAAMRQLGVDDHTMQSALQQAGNASDVGIAAALSGEAAQGWRHLYLGEIAPQRFAALVRPIGLQDAAAVSQAVQGLAGVHWVDKRGHLNILFEQTRNLAAWLKLASLGAAWLLLWRLFGARRGAMILAVPLCALACSVALLGYLGLPVSLFAMFGLLLTAAVGIDYAVYVGTAPHSAAARLTGMWLAAATTLISFGLLGGSSTPAVAAFGITVAAGVVFALLFAWLLLYQSLSEP